MKTSGQRCYDQETLTAARSELTGGRLRVALNRVNTLVARVAENGSVDGPGAVLTRLVARDLGLTPEFLLYEGAAAVLAAQERDGWHVALVAPDPARVDLRFTSPYVELRATLRVAGGAEIHRIEDADRPGIEIASVEGAAFDRRLRDQVRRARVMACTTPAEAVEMLLSGRVPAAAGIRGVLEDAEDRTIPTRILDDDFARLAQTFAVPRTHPALARLFENEATGFAEGQGSADPRRNR